MSTSTLTIGVPKETAPGERRVALVPAVIAPLKKAGFDVIVERGAGSAAGFPDAEYEKHGAAIGDRTAAFAAGVIAQVRTSAAWGPGGGAADLSSYRAGQIVIGFSDPLSNAGGAREMAARGVTSFSMELMPRITRAQSMDALSSMATIAGYKAVLEAATVSPRLFPMLTTAAGTISPARVFVIGAGVAGLMAIATARRLGARVEAYDVRPAAKEQVMSLGARFAELPLETEGAEDKGGYATAQDESFYRRQREAMLKWVSGSDIVITTAAVPGKKSPVLITAEMVAAMAPGSVIVDLAAERGGNCEITKANEIVTAPNGVTVLGPTNLPGSVPHDASQMYARNVTTFLLHLARREKGQEGAAVINWDMADEITRDTLVTRDGAVVHERIKQL
ncbi:MAG: Re/Si-specific NAD(P)(+) transhydrogenase subunit alpha [Acidobacteriota bacterium]|nr:Re/Si-specific NAD(P)(+) transhydrogenase subunit alpha [Acidobacteriota bacterium]